MGYTSESYKGSNGDLRPRPPKFSWGGLILTIVFFASIIIMIIVQGMK